MRHFLKAVTPPVLVSAGRRLERFVQGRGTPPEWEPRPHGWASPEQPAGGNGERARLAYRADCPPFAGPGLDA